VREVEEGGCDGGGGGGGRRGAGVTKGGGVGGWRPGSFPVVPYKQAAGRRGQEEGHGFSARPVWMWGVGRDKGMEA